MKGGPPTVGARWFEVVLPIVLPSLRLRSSGSGPGSLELRATNTEHMSDWRGGLERRMVCYGTTGTTDSTTDTVELLHDDTPSTTYQ